MICIAKTGSGKTCGFLLPSLHQFIQAGGRPKNQRPGNMAENGPVLLVLAPTRELACQIMDESQRFGRSCGARTICCFGGSNKFPQIAAFERGIEVVIATPGRLNDLLEMKKADLSRVKFLVLDEAGECNNNERSLLFVPLFGGGGFSFIFLLFDTLTNTVPSPIYGTYFTCIFAYYDQIECWTWVSSHRSVPLWQRSRNKGRLFSFRPRGPRRSRGSPMIS